MIAVIAGLLSGLVCLVWWTVFSRVPRRDRWGALGLIVAAVAATRPTLLHPSIAGGMMGMMFPIYVIPGLSLALVAWAAFGRRPGMAAILAACGVWALARTDGITGEGNAQLTWRWRKTAEEQLLAKPVVEPVPAKTTASAQADWPGFRGPHRDSVVTGVRIKTGWGASPPVELWRHAVGPGWSSFAAGGGLIYTQEQRGEFETVACYDAATGKPVWKHQDAARFWESNGGAGPRGTPALHAGRIYTMGGTGIVNALDARGGAVIWTRNAAKDTGAKLPGWGFSSSPLVLDDVVVVAAAGRLAAYDLSSGAPRWVKTEGAGGYSSPQLLTVGGVPQIVFLNGGGANGIAPADGAVLWKHEWPGAAMLQPALTADGGVLIATTDMSGGIGVRRLSVSQGSVKEEWTSNGLKPYFNDFVVHDGHAYGFDGGILSCITLQDGKRKWKGGRYGHGQMLLLAEQKILLVLSEEGEVALVEAAPGQFTEIARFRAMEGKTWNHPVLVPGMLLVRNGQEMAAFRL
jgi:outer membrane protein assembly factor BamB